MTWERHTLDLCVSCLQLEPLLLRRRWLEQNQAGPPLVPSDAALQKVIEKVVRQVTPGIVSAGLDYLAGSSGRCCTTSPNCLQ